MDATKVSALVDTSGYVLVVFFVCFAAVFFFLLQFSICSGCFTVFLRFQIYQEDGKRDSRTKGPATSSSEWLFFCSFLVNAWFKKKKAGTSLCRLQSAVCVCDTPVMSTMQTNTASTYVLKCRCSTWQMTHGRSSIWINTRGVGESN